MEGKYLITTKSKPMTLKSLESYLKRAAKDEVGNPTLLGAGMFVSEILQYVPLSPVLSNIGIGESGSLEATLISKPIPGSSSVLDYTYLSYILKTYDLGELLEGVSTPILESNPIMDIILPESSFSNIQSVPMDVYLHEELTTIERGTFKIGQTSYTQIKLKVAYETLEETKEFIDVVLLFSNKQYDGQTFLGSLPQELSKSATIKVLDALSDLPVVSNLLLSTVIDLGQGNYVYLDGSASDLDIRSSAKDTSTDYRIQLSGGALTLTTETIQSGKLISTEHGWYSLHINRKGGTDIRLDISK